MWTSFPDLSSMHPTIPDHVSVYFNPEVPRTRSSGFFLWFTFLSRLSDSLLCLSCHHSTLKARACRHNSAVDKHATCSVYSCKRPYIPLDYHHAKSKLTLELASFCSVCLCSVIFEFLSDDCGTSFQDATRNLKRGCTNHFFVASGLQFRTWASTAPDAHSAGLPCGSFYCCPRFQ